MPVRELCVQADVGFTRGGLPVQLSFNLGRSSHAPTTMSFIRWFVLVGVVAVIGCMALGGRAYASNVLVVQGTNAEEAPAGPILRDRLLARGDTVTLLTSTPADLTAFTVIYDVRVFAPSGRSPTVLAQYLTFLNQAPGNVLFLLGENANPLFTESNQAITDFIALAGGGVVVRPTVSENITQTVAVGFRTPNVNPTVNFNLYGFATSSGTGSFLTTRADGTSGTALSFAPGTLANAPTSALVVVYDINFILGSSPEFFTNLINYVAVGAPPPNSPVGTVPTITAISPSTSNSNGGGTVTITGTNFTGATAVTFGGVAATSFSVVNATTVTAVVPAQTPGVKEVIVTTPQGANAAAPTTNDFTVTPIVVPTMTEWAMMLFGIILAGGAALQIHRRRMTV